VEHLEEDFYVGYYALHGGVVIAGEQLLGYLFEDEERLLVCKTLLD